MGQRGTRRCVLAAKRMQIRGQTQHIQRFLVAATKPLCCAPAELSRAERSRAAGIRFGGAQSQLNLQRARPATSDRWMLALQLRARKRDTVALMQPSRRLYHQQSGSTQWRASEFPQVCQEREREQQTIQIHHDCCRSWNLGASV